MNDDFRRSITFEQAMGLEPLPTQLKLDEASPALKSRLWALVHMKIDACTSNYGGLLEPMSRIAKLYVIQRENGLIDEWKNSSSKLVEKWKRHFSPSASIYAALGFMEWFVRVLDNDAFTRAVARSLEQERAAYRLIDQSIIPIASPEEGEAIIRAVQLAKSEGMEGVRTHIEKASTALTAGSFADSVRESIHAVEAVAINKTGNKSSFSGALKDLNKTQPMHDAFRIALEKLYGYTSDEQGVRHSLFAQGDANVTERDALFMLGVCASFVTYLLNPNGPKTT